MTEPRPRTFLWITRNGIPFPQVVFDDPRVGCAGLAPVAGTERKLEPEDGRSLDMLARDYPTPMGETV